MGVRGGARFPLFDEGKVELVLRGVGTWALCAGLVGSVTSTVGILLTLRVSASSNVRGSAVVGLGSVDEVL